MDTKRPMSPHSSSLIEFHSSHHPFVSSCNTTDLSSTSSPMQTTNHPLITPSILTNHIPPTNGPHQPPTFHVNEGSQLYTLSNPLNHAQLGHFPPPTLLVATISLDHTPQPTPISSTHLQPPLEILCPTCGCQFINRRLVHYQRSC
jgi:hypothetical protein